MNNMSSDIANQTVALKLATAGIFTFPCVTTKKPIGKFKWRDRSSNKVDLVKTWWRQNPKAIPAIDCGKSGIIVLDPDRHGDQDGLAALAALEADNEPLPVHPIIKTPNGEHHIFKMPEGKSLGNHEGKLKNSGINVRGKGGYIIACGAVIPKGSFLSDGTKAEYDQYYTGDADSPALIESFEADTIPYLPQWVVDIITATDEAPSMPLEREKAYARAALDGNYREIARMSANSGRNNTLNACAYRMGRMVARGWINESEVERSFTSACHHNGLTAADGAPQVLATIRSGLNAGKLKPHEDIVAEIPPYDPETGEIIEYVQPTYDLDELAAEDRLPGLLGDLTNWIYATSRNPNRILSLASALTVIGTLVGRRVAGPTDSGTHLYVLLLAPTGFGKDHSLDVTLTLLKGAGAEELIGANEFTTDNAVANLLLRTPCSLCAMDEFGSFLKGINSKKASRWEKNVSKQLRTIWGKSFKIMTTSEFVSRAREIITWPALSILGASTHDEFYDALGEGDLSNGTLNRFLVFSVTKRGAEQEDPMSAREVPDELVRKMRSLYFPDDQTKLNRPMVTIPWESDEVKGIYHNLRRSVLSRMEEDQSLEHYIGRTAEYAVRLATIRAVGRDGDDAKITIDDIEWGAELASMSGDMLTMEARRHMSPGMLSHTNKHDIILKAIKKKKEINHSGLLRQLSRIMGSKEINPIIDDLITSGIIKKDERASKVGPPAKFYMAA